MLNGLRPWNNCQNTAWCLQTLNASLNVSDLNSGLHACHACPPSARLPNRCHLAYESGLRTVSSTEDASISTVIFESKLGARVGSTQHAIILYSFFSHKSFAICKYLSTFSFALYTNCVVFLARSLLCADPHSWFLSSLIPSMLGDLPLRLRSLNCASKGYDCAGCHVSSAKTSLSPSICAEKNFSRRNQGLGCK